MVDSLPVLSPRGTGDRQPSDPSRITAPIVPPTRSVHKRSKVIEEVEDTGRVDETLGCRNVVGQGGHREHGDGGQPLGQVRVPQWVYLKASSWVGARACLVSDHSYAHVQPVGPGSAEKGKPQKCTDKGGWVGAEESVEDSPSFSLFSPWRGVTTS